MTEKRPCRKCGCPIELVMGPKGKYIPVQKVTLAYMKARTKDEDGEERLVQLQVKDEFDGELMEFYVSHFQTCSDPARFSRKGSR